MTSDKITVPSELDIRVSEASNTMQEILGRFKRNDASTFEEKRSNDPRSMALRIIDGYATSGDLSQVIDRLKSIDSLKDQEIQRIAGKYNSNYSNGQNNGSHLYPVTVEDIRDMLGKK